MAEEAFLDEEETEWKEKSSERKRPRARWAEILKLRYIIAP